VIFVDEPRIYDPKDSHTRRWGKQWSHMWTDGNIEDLHQMAKRLGLKREYFQDKPGFPHYDIIPIKRKLALKLGAQFTPLKEWFRHVRTSKTC
jgi:hypothetical protein